MKKKTTAFKAMLCVYIIFCLIFFHQRVGTQIKDALKLWSGVLIPSLFPYLVLSQYITSSDVMDIFAPLKAILQRIFNISSVGANVYLCSLVSGYPTGAVCVSELYKNKSIGKEEAERIACFTNSAGPLFVISVVGNMLGSGKDGLALYVIQSISASLVGMYLGFKAKKCVIKNLNIKPLGKSLTNCTQDAINIMLAIGGYVVMASVIGEIALIGLEMLPVYDESMCRIARAVIYFFLEISNSMKVLSSFGNSTLTFALIASAASWSGLCVLMQIKSVLPKAFSVKKIVCAKGCQSAISFVLGFVYKSFFGTYGIFNSDKMFVASLFMSVFLFGVYLLNAKRKKLSI